VIDRSGQVRWVDLLAKVNSVITLLPVVLDFLDDGKLNGSVLLRLFGS